MAPHFWEFAVALAVDHEPSSDIRVREIAELIGTQFREILSRTLLAQGKDSLVPYSSAQVDAIYDLLCRGVIEPGTAVFR